MIVNEIVKNYFVMNSLFNTITIYFDLKTNTFLC